MDMTCFAMRDVKLPWGKRNFNEKAHSFLGDCAVLECDCPGALNCPFYTTRERLEEQKRKAFVRINSLPEYRQLGIAIKYYGGQMPWKGAGVVI